MSEELSLGDANVPKNVQNVMAQEALEITRNIESSVKLSEAEKKQIEDNKTKPKEKVIKADSNSSLTEAEIEECMSLKGDLDQFIMKNTDLKKTGKDIEKIPTGIDLLDAIMGGGIGAGTFTMIAGNPGTFKSALVAQIIASAQRIYKGKCACFYKDTESAMTQERLYQMGVRYPPIEPDDDTTVEDIFKTLEAIFAYKMKTNSDYPALVAWDSIANTSTEKERTTQDINQTIGLRARLLSSLMPRYVPKMKEYRTSLIAVNQLRENLDIGQFSPAADLRWMGDKLIPGGQSLKFNAFHLMILKIRGDIKFETYGINGVRLEAKCVKNKFFKPNIPVELLVDFNHGISNFWSNYHFLVTHKKISSSAWNKWADGETTNSWRTKDALDMYKNDTDGFKEKFDAAVKETIQSVIIDPNKPMGLDESIL